MTDIFALFRKIGSTTPEKNAPVSAMVVGLGNPGGQYERTRHNAGFMALDALADACHIDVRTARFHALVGDGMVGRTHCLLMKPQTFMNLSGDAVAEAAAFYHIQPSRILVFCDDVSFDVGRTRIRLKGSHGGHNGLRSIEARLGSSDYMRIKIGVGKKPTPDYDLAAWVLARIPEDELPALRESLAHAVSATPLLLEGKVDEARNLYSS